MKDSREQPKLIDTINFTTDKVFLEDCIGRINFPINIGQCSIYVYSNEGAIPHFHIIPKNGIGESCICIYEPLYFNHGSKQLRLNSKQRKILDDWLEQQSTIAPEVTNWRLICISWETGNGNKYIPKNPIKPNYRNMENMIN